MSYDLAFWEGARPATDEEALAVFESTFDALEEADDDVPATATIDALVRALESRWPGEQPGAPWATFPLAEDAQGGTLYVNLVLRVANAVVEEAAEIAARLGVVCFDPQREMLL